VLPLLLAAAVLASAADGPEPALAQFEQRVVSTLAARSDDAAKAELRREFQSVSP
jgi:spermidine/putrescine-binding protein